jgi:hypothetical protein
MYFLGQLRPSNNRLKFQSDPRPPGGFLFDAPHMVVFPALAVMTAVLAFNLLGDARDWLDPRMRSQMAVLELTR